MVLNPDIRILYPETFIKMHESNSVRFVESNPLSSIYINIRTPGAKAPGVLMLLYQLMYADLTKDTPLYQFATAFPVGTSVAQTWNEYP